MYVRRSLLMGMEESMSKMSMNIPEKPISSNAEILFPSRYIPILRDLRGDEWRALVDEVSDLPERHPDSLAFVLMVIELNECLKCHSRSYKYLRGCALCATQLIQSFKGTDAELLQRYRMAQQKIWHRLQADPDTLSMAA
jgi:hypothetical protein